MGGDLVTVSAIPPMCNAYMVWCGGDLDCANAALLVFHHTGRKAKALAWSSGSWINETGDFIDLRTRKLHGAHICKEHTTDAPEVIESPRTCPQCELWGGEPITLKREEDVYLKGERIFEKGEEFEACGFCEDDDDSHAWR